MQSDRFVGHIGIKTSCPDWTLETKKEVPESNLRVSFLTFGSELLELISSSCFITRAISNSVEDLTYFRSQLLEVNQILNAYKVSISQRSIGGNASQINSKSKGQKALEDISVPIDPADQWVLKSVASALMPESVLAFDQSSIDLRTLSHCLGELESLSGEIESRLNRLAAQTERVSAQINRYIELCSTFFSQKEAMFNRIFARRGI